MCVVPLPAILNKLACAGESGMPFSSAPSFQRELEVCQKWGFSLSIAGGRVYLPFSPDQLVPYWIEKETPAFVWDRLRVEGFLQIGSTNDEALERARQGTPSGTLIYAEEQITGRGRQGRTWISPPGAGLCFTLVLRPRQPAEFWPLLTHVASVALAKTLENLSNQGLVPHPLAIDLKWPNDVLLSGKKCAGLLLETTATDKALCAAAVGVGINVHEGSVPDSLRDKATCVDEQAGAFVPRRRLLVSFLSNCQIYYDMFERHEHRELLDHWKSHSSMWNGTPIWIADGGARRPAVTCGLSEIGALLVRTPEGTVETVLAGDITVRRAG